VILRRNAYARKDFLVIFTKLDSPLADYKPAYPLSQSSCSAGRMATALGSARFENFSVKNPIDA